MPTNFDKLDKAYQAYQRAPRPTWKQVSQFIIPGLDNSRYYRPRHHVRRVQAQVTSHLFDMPKRSLFKKRRQAATRWTQPSPAALNYFDRVDALTRFTKVELIQKIIQLEDSLQCLC